MKNINKTKSSVVNMSKLNSIKNYNLNNDYVVDMDGNVFKIVEENKNNYILKPMSPFKNRYGYMEYVLTNKDKIKKHIMMHVAVCGCYKRKPIGKDYVNHIDGNTINNHISNLEWTTFSENMKHSYDNGRVPKNQYTK